MDFCFMAKPFNNQHIVIKIFLNIPTTFLGVPVLLPIIEMYKDFLILLSIKSQICTLSEQILQISRDELSVWVKRCQHSCMSTKRTKRWPSFLTCPDSMPNLGF